MTHTFCVLRWKLTSNTPRSHFIAHRPRGRAVMHPLLLAGVACLNICQHHAMLCSALLRGNSSGRERWASVGQPTDVFSKSTQTRLLPLLLWLFSIKTPFRPLHPVGIPPFVRILFQHCCSAAVDSIPMITG